MYYYAIDGIEVGKKLERLIIEGDDEEIHAFSINVSQHVELLSNLFSRQGAEIIFATGDGLLAKSSERLDLTIFPLSRESVCFSLGVGSSPLEACIAMRLGRFSGSAAESVFPWRK